MDFIRHFGLLNDAEEVPSMADAGGLTAYEGASRISLLTLTLSTTSSASSSRRDDSDVPLHRSHATAWLSRLWAIGPLSTSALGRPSNPVLEPPLRVGKCLRKFFSHSDNSSTHAAQNEARRIDTLKWKLYVWIACLFVDEISLLTGVGNLACCGRRDAVYGDD